MEKNMSDFLDSVAGHIEDPLTLHIVKHFWKLKSANTRLKSVTDKPNRWKSLQVAEWKPFDFFFYFVHRYEDRYKKSYPVVNNSKVATYQKIESFMVNNKISNDRFKEYIDKAFMHYFSMMNRPRVEFLLQADTYEKLFGDSAKNTTRSDLLSLDARLREENERFEDALRESKNA